MRTYAADVAIGDFVMWRDGEAVPPGRPVVWVAVVGPDQLMFHYDDDGEPDIYDAKTQLLVSR